MALPSPREPRWQQRTMGDMSQSPAEGGTRSEHTDGTLPSGQYWQGWPVQAPAGAVVLAPGVHEHSRRYRHVAGRPCASCTAAPTGWSPRQPARSSAPMPAPRTSP